MASITHVPMVAALPPSRPPVGAPPREKAVRQNKTIIMLYNYISHLTSSLKSLDLYSPYIFYGVKSKLYLPRIYRNWFSFLLNATYMWIARSTIKQVTHRNQTFM